MSLRNVRDDRTDCGSADYNKALDRFLLGHVLWGARLRRFCASRGVVCEALSYRSQHPMRVFHVLLLQHTPRMRYCLFVSLWDRVEEASFFWATSEVF